jgi:cobalt-zinc-cadmium efflux system protein
MHGGHKHASRGSAARMHQKPLLYALGLTIFYLIVEVIGALLTGSLALLADAAHMLTDAGGLALALVAITLAKRPVTLEKTFGYLRAEILAALLNAVVLLLITVYILYEAYQRFSNPPDILSIPMLVVAAFGLIVNFIAMRLLQSGAEESLNLKGAYFEVLSDMLGSLGVIAASVIIMLTGWRIVDPIIGAAIGLFIVPRTIRLLNESVHILLEGTPAGVDLTALRKGLLTIGGVKDVCDLHVWTITSGLNAMSGHLVVDDMQGATRILRAARTLLNERYKIQHVTIQIEDEVLHREEARLPI